MRLFDLFHKVGIDKKMIIKDDCERKLFCDKFSDLSMKFAYYEVCKVIEENGIIIVYI